VAAQRGLVSIYLIIARGDSMRDVILPHAFLKSSGSLAKFIAMRRASSLVSSLAAVAGQAPLRKKCRRVPGVGVPFSRLAACGPVERAHTRLVGDIDPNLTIRALQRKDGTWCVCATPPYGLSTYMGDFRSEVEAQNWIIHKAKDHFPRRNRPVLETC